MSERYTKLFSLPADLYAQGSPIVVSAGNLLKDNQTGRVLAQLKIRNIAPKAVKAATVLVRALDSAGLPLGSDAKQEYLDLAVGQGMEFGQKVPVPLPDPSTRGFTVAIARVVFADNSLWEGTASPWEPLPAAKPIGDPELVKEFSSRFKGACTFLPQAHKDLWRCACGIWNRGPACYACSKDRDALLTLDLAALNAEKDRRLAREQADREAQAAAAEAAAKAVAARTRKTLEILIPALTLCAAVAFLIVKVVIPTVHYQEAAALSSAGRYEEAIAAFEALDGFKDSEAQIAAAQGALADQARQAEEARLEAAYAAAVALYDAGKYEEAIAAFEAMNGYKDSAAQIEACKTAILDRAYDAAVALYDAGRYEEAIDAFKALKGYKDSAARIEACQTVIWDREYDAALALIAAGQYREGFTAFAALKGYKDSDRLRRECLIQVALRNTTISAGKNHSVGVRANGTVVAAGTFNPWGELNVSGWTDIVAIAAGYWHTVGLKSDGTVVVAGNKGDGRCDVDRWTDIVAVAAGTAHTVGLKADGTVVAVGLNDHGQCNVSEWTDIVAIAASNGHTVGLRSDGTVVATAYTGNQNDYHGECNVSGWKDIVAIAAGAWHTVGLKANGTVVAVGKNFSGQCDVTDWKDIVAIAAGKDYTIGLRSDGTVAAVGINYIGQCDVTDWTDIVAIAAGEQHTIGLRSDGTVVAVGHNGYSQCDVSGWTDIRVPGAK